MDKVKVGDTEIAYRIDGEGDHVVVLVHSLALNADAWHPIYERLGERFRLLSLDLRGHGDSPATPAPYTIEQMADDVVGLMDALGIDTASFVGVSVGGRIGQSLLVRYPQRFKKAVLAASVIDMDPAAHPVWTDRYDVLRAKGMSGIMTSTIERWYGPTIVNYPISQLDAIAAMMSRCSVEGYIGVGEALFASDCRAELGRIATPVLVVAGDSDVGAPPTVGAELASLIPGAELVILADCGHQPALQQPDTFADVLRGFIGKV